MNPRMHEHPRGPPVSAASGIWLIWLGDTMFLPCIRIAWGVFLFSVSVLSSLGWSLSTFVAWQTPWWSCCTWATAPCSGNQMPSGPVSGPSQGPHAPIAAPREPGLVLPETRQVSELSLQMYKSKRAPQDSLSAASCLKQRARFWFPVVSTWIYFQTDSQAKARKSHSC